MSLDLSPSPPSQERAAAQSSRWNAPEAEVAKAAYYIWEKEGRPSGRELDHWLRAETQVRKLVNVGAIRDQNS
jgi:hypothetical protein